MFEDNGYVYFDDDDDNLDEYERYEECYLDTGYDPYGMFEEPKPPSFMRRVLRQVSRVKSAVVFWWRYHTNADFRKGWNKIPF